MMQVANGSLVTIVSQSQQWCSGMGRWRGSTPVWRLEWGFKQKVCTVLWPWMSGCCRHTKVIRTQSVGIMRFGMWSCTPCVCNLGYERLSSSPFAIFFNVLLPLSFLQVMAEVRREGICDLWLHASGMISIPFIPGASVFCLNQSLFPSHYMESIRAYLHACSNRRKPKNKRAKWRFMCWRWSPRIGEDQWTF